MPYLLAAMLAFLLVAGGVNLVWDLTFRRGEARRLTATRREARPRALPSVDDPAQAEPASRLHGSEPDDALARFVGATRATFTELDELIDRFDFLVLRARAKERHGAAFVRSQRPRTLALALLERWLEQVRALDQSTARMLADVALGPETIEGVLERERERMRLEFTCDSERSLAETTTDLDRAVIHLQQVVRLLESSRNDPYRLG